MANHIWHTYGSVMGYNHDSLLVGNYGSAGLGNAMKPMNHLSMGYKPTEPQVTLKISRKKSTGRSQGRLSQSSQPSPASARSCGWIFSRLEWDFPMDFPMGHGCSMAFPWVKPRVFPRKWRVFRLGHHRCRSLALRKSKIGTRKLVVRNLTA